jgi:hypothetical protein
LLGYHSEHSSLGSMVFLYWHRMLNETYSFDLLTVAL